MNITSNNISLSENVTEVEAQTAGYSTERVIIGLIYLNLTLSMLIPYSIAVHVIKTDKQIYDSAFRLIALNMGCADIIQLVFVGLSPASVCLLLWDVPRYVRKFSGAMGGFSWFTYVSLAEVMAVNRFISIFWPAIVKRIYSKTTTIIMIICCWIIGLVWFCIYESPNATVAFELSANGMAYDLSESGSLKALFASSVINWMHSASICVIYGLIYYHIRQKGKKITFASVITDHEKKEKKVLLQSVCLCAMDVAMSLFWAIFQWIPFSRWATMAANIALLISAGGNSYLYITLNSTIRQKFKEVMSCGTQASSAVAGIQTTHHDISK